MAVLSTTQPRWVAEPAPGEPELHLGLVGFGVGDEFLEIVGGQILAHQQGDWDLGDQPDWREVGEGVVQRLFVQRLALRRVPTVPSRMV